MTVAVAIVGAGPYGLSLAAHLAERGVEHRIIGTPMGNWEHHMPDGMFLKSEGLASSIDDLASYRSGSVASPPGPLARAPGVAPRAGIMIGATF